MSSVKRACGGSKVVSSANGAERGDGGERGLARSLCWRWPPCGGGAAAPATKGKDLMPGLLASPVHWMVGPEGGQFKAGIVDFDVPKGAVASMMEVTVSTALPSAAEQEEPFDFLTPVFSFEPHGLTFASPVKARVHLFLPLAENEEGGIYWSTPEGGWEELRSETQPDGAVIFEVAHFSEMIGNRQGRWGGKDIIDGTYRGDGFECSKKTDCGGAGQPYCNIQIPLWRYPEAGSHIMDEMANYGNPAGTLTKGDKDMNSMRREQSLAAWMLTSEGQMFRSRECVDRDEFPPAMSNEGGAARAGARATSVRPIDSSDNRGAGSCMGSQASGMHVGDRFTFSFVATPPSGVNPFGGPLKCVPKGDGGVPMDAGGGGGAAGGGAGGRGGNPGAGGGSGAGGRGGSSGGAGGSSGSDGEAGQGGSAGSVGGAGGAGGQGGLVQGTYVYGDPHGENYSTAEQACAAWVATNWPDSTFVSATVLDDGQNVKCVWQWPDGTEGVMHPGGAARVLACPANSRPADNNDHVSTACECDAQFEAHGNDCVPVAQ